MRSMIRELTEQLMGETILAMPLITTGLDSRSTVKIPWLSP